jgi:DNA-binding MurR/RpiR family transcriptional regulator
MNHENLSRVPHEFALRIQAIYDDLKSAERKAVDFILKSPEELPGLNIVDFADRAGCSEATIVRLSKRLGYDGYPQLKAAFEENQEGSDTGYHEIDPEDPPLTVMKKVFESGITALEDTLQLLDTQEYQASLEALLASRQLLVCGLGDAGVVATETSYRFNRIGKQCHAPTDPDMQLIHASKLQRGDVFLGISHSGRSTSVMDVAEVAAAAGATVIAITNFPTSPLAKLATHVLQTAVFTRDWTGEIMAKRLAQLCIIESLHANYLLRDRDNSVQQLRASNQVVRRNKQGSRGETE